MKVTQNQLLANAVNALQAAGISDAADLSQRLKSNPDDYPDEPEVVDLAPDAIDLIADRVAIQLSGGVNLKTDPVVSKLHGNVQPQRTLLGSEDGPFVARKSGEIGGSAYYGGHDQYTLAGETDADRAVNLYIAKTMLESRDVRTGRGGINDWTGEPLVSDRLRQVMVGSATKALRESPPAIPDYVQDGSGFRKAVDVDRFVTKGYNALRHEAAVKAMTSTGANTGDEWVPTFATSELWRDVHLQTEIAANVRRVEMPTNPYQLPTEISDATFRYASNENTSVTASNVGTDKATLTASKVMAEIDFSGELTEDSIVAIVPAFKANLTRRAAQTIDDLIVHGDTQTAGTGNINSDDAAPSAGQFYLALDGMRKFCIATNTAQKKDLGTATTAALFNTTRQLLGKYGARASDLVCVTGVSTLLSLNTLSEVLTLEKYGPNATVLRGELARLFNVPILLSEAIPSTSTDKTDADGKYTTTSPTSNNTKGWFLLFNTNSWTTGFRRGLQIESFRDIQKDQNILVASFRMALIPSGIATTHTVYAYDATV